MKNLLPLILLALLAGCTTFKETVDSLPQAGSDPVTFYWHNKRLTADTVPDIVKAQAILEDDLTACGYEVFDRRRWMRVNDPVSTKEGHVVDEKGTPRDETELPTTYELSQCMEKKGWVKLDHYYTIPY